MIFTLYRAHGAGALCALYVYEGLFEIMSEKMSSPSQPEKIENMILNSNRPKNMNKKILNSNQLKIIACISMLIDHAGLVLFDNNMIMRGIGRLAFPIYVFLLVEGFRHTSNAFKYTGRLLMFALLSEIPYDLAVKGRVLEFTHQNIFFTLAFGVMTLGVLQLPHMPKIQKYVIVVAIMILCQVLRFDYGMGGILLVLIFNTLRDNRKSILQVTGLSAIVYFAFWGALQLVAVFAMIPISLYDGNRGKLKLKYVFYAFYPVHLLVLWVIGKM